MMNSMTIKVAAQICRIPYENAKAIVRVYRKEGRKNRFFELKEYDAAYNGGYE